MNAKLSVIVPVYNSVDTIVRCAASLVNQTMENIEVIFVDDCSTDESLDLLHQIRQQFPEKVRLLQTKRNSGPGGARNIGLDAATGDYVGFVDSDDFVDGTMYEKLYKAAVEAQADVVDCGFADESLGSYIFSVNPECTGDLDDEKRCRLISKEGYIWCKIFRRDLIEKNKLRFRESALMEDTDFIMCVWALASKVAVVPEVLYQHTDNQVSVTHVADNYKNYMQSLSAMEAVHHRLSELPQYHAIEEGVKAMLTGLYLGAIVNIATSQEKELTNSKKVECLTNLREVRRKVMDSDYENAYQIEGMNDQCIMIMQLNDRNPKAVVQLLASA